MVVKDEVNKKAASEAAPTMKMEMKQEAALEVKLEVNDQPSSLPCGQLPASRPTKRARTETPPPPLPLPEPWRAAFSIPPIYRSPSDREWAGYNTAIWLSAIEAGIIVIDDDDDGGASANARAKRHFSFNFMQFNPHTVL
jgi:hypothetical protein